MNLLAILLEMDDLFTVKFKVDRKSIANLLLIILKFIKVEVSSSLPPLPRVKLIAVKLLGILSVFLGENISSASNYSNVKAKMPINDSAKEHFFFFFCRIQYEKVVTNEITVACVPE